jgi:hypothetical protein
MTAASIDGRGQMIKSHRKSRGKLQQRILGWGWPVAALTLVALLGAWFLQSTIPRHIVLASGLKDGLYHQYAQRYKELLARDGVTVEERLTGGADENERLLRDRNQRDVAFMHGGVVRRPSAATWSCSWGSTTSRSGFSTAIRRP